MDLNQRPKDYEFWNRRIACPIELGTGLLHPVSTDLTRCQEISIKSMGYCQLECTAAIYVSHLTTTPLQHANILGAGSRAGPRVLRHSPQPRNSRRSSVSAPGDRRAEATIRDSARSLQRLRQTSESQGEAGNGSAIRRSVEEVRRAVNSGRSRSQSGHDRGRDRSPSNRHRSRPSSGASNAEILALFFVRVGHPLAV